LISIETHESYHQETIISIFCFQVSTIYKQQNMHLNYFYVDISKVILTCK